MHSLNGVPVDHSPVLAMLRRIKAEEHAHHEALPYIPLRSLLLVRMVDEATGTFSRCDTDGRVSAHGHAVQAIYPDCCRLIDILAGRDTPRHAFV